MTNDPGGDRVETGLSPLPLGEGRYDASACRVTLLFQRPTSLGKSFRYVWVDGRGSSALRDSAGNLLDGNYDGSPGGDAELRFIFRSKKTLTYVDADGKGDQISLRLKGLWRLYMLLGGLGDSFLVVGADPARSVLTGSVRRFGRKGDGFAFISQLGGAASTDLRFLTDPRFVVASVTP